MIATAYFEGIEFGKSRSDCDPRQVDFLLDLVEQTQDVPGDIVEIGSWKCGCSIAMASANPDKQVYAFDLFGGLPYGPGNGFESFGAVSYYHISIAARPYKNLHLVRGLHEFTVPRAAQKKLPISLLFLDSDHYSSHKVTLKHFRPLLPHGGIVAFHDWVFPAVQQAVRETLVESEFVPINEVLGMRAIRAL